VVATAVAVEIVVADAAAACSIITVITATAAVAANAAAAVAAVAAVDAVVANRLRLLPVATRTRALPRLRQPR
jgi:hypothetical protein